ncbi:hypothetical protein B0H14DRAFT_2559988 [Mycena olivaceomarginata]|nr:hypothetical protein B0H14DRAFT_2559988 [Mycena olivaceomarginata]
MLPLHKMAGWHTTQARSKTTHLLAANAITVEGDGKQTSFYEELVLYGNPNLHLCILASSVLARCWLGVDVVNGIQGKQITPWMLVPANTGFHNEGLSISNCRYFAELAGHAKIASLRTN